MGRARSRSQHDDPADADGCGSLPGRPEPDALPGRKRFTLAEANRALPYVRRVVVDIVEQYTRIVALRKAAEPGVGEGTPPASPPVSASAPEADYEVAMDDLGRLVDELHAVGVELRDFEHGVIAFPATHADRPILLSWQPPEPAVTHWHAPDESISDRRPLPALTDAA